MPTFLIQSEVTIKYRHTITADTLEEAVEQVEDGEDDGVEVDSSAPRAVEYALLGQMGWSPIPDNPER
jgi:hypothetical protein